MAKSSAPLRLVSASTHATTQHFTDTPAQAPVARTCTPPGVLPAVQPAPVNTPGLNLLLDNPVTYTIYGTSPGQIHRQLRSCAPGADHLFSASTDFWIGSRYSYTSTGNGTCKLTNVAITLRIRQVFPDWSTTAGSPSAVQAQWQQYNASLHTHEHGHVIIDEQYARTALSTLKALPPQPCEAINSAATVAMNRIVAAMNNANDLYDARTHHGATQGAVWR